MFQTPIKLFINYSSVDSARVDQIVSRLRNLKAPDNRPRFDVWQDKDGIPAGKDWWLAIVDAIMNCDVFVFNISRSALDSEVCRSEFRYAHERNCPIIPIVLEGEYRFNPLTGRNDIDYWNKVPPELNESRSQFLFYDGTGFYKQFDEALAEFTKKPRHYIDVLPPIDPRKGNQMQTGEGALYDEAYDYAGRLEFKMARSLFRKLIDRHKGAFSKEASEWITLLNKYEQLIELDARVSTRFRVASLWSEYTALFPKSFIEKIFDPKGFATRYGKPNSPIEPLAHHNKSVSSNDSADLPNMVNLLDLFQAQTIPELNIQQRWEKSRSREAADWLRTPLGKRSIRDDLALTLYFHQDFDGVHGLIAGTSGSGKSELLLALIIGLAISYDPSIVNFVLIDYKDGAVFDSLRSLPHVVEIVSDIANGKKILERVFEGLKGELSRRAKLLADYEVKHIVEYRSKGYHLAETVLPNDLRAKGLKPQPFPHLFIIVDEFADLVHENKDYKDRFDSITRLGRATGVSLLLAAQHPAGAVSDQMRANMKLHISLRVDTSDDSHELLGQGDAMFLPSNIPGRAYMQAGREVPVLVQIARMGRFYVDLIVSEAVRLATFISKQQYKPWPNPLPAQLSLNEPVEARHLITRRKKDGNKIVLNPFIRLWMTHISAPHTLNSEEKQRLNDWKAGAMVNWESASLRTTIGLIDLPDRAEQHLMTLDLTIGPVVIFGAGGWGKTTFLKSLMISLAASHTPRELHFYALDFARGALKGLSHLPHMETPIDVTEEARVERLLRMLATEMDKREPKLRPYGSLAAYNREHPDDVLPALVIVVDNFAEFKETYEELVPEFTRLMRGGRALGIYFIVTADQVAAIPNRLYSLMTQRFALKMADLGDYEGIVGRVAHFLTATPGRGAMVVDRQAREFHVAVPTYSTNLTASGFYVEHDYEDHFITIADAMQYEWGLGRSAPEPIQALSSKVSILDMLDQAQVRYKEKVRHLRAVIGQRDVDRWPALLDLNSHAFIMGPAASGKTVTLHSLIIALAETHTPDELSFVLIDPKQHLFENEEITLTALPHVLKVVSESGELDELDALLQVEFDTGLQTWLHDYPAWAAEQHSGNGARLADVPLNTISPTRKIIIIIDNYDDTRDLERPRLFDHLARLARQQRGRLHFVIGLTEYAFKTPDELIKRVATDRNALVLQDTDIVGTLGGRVRPRLTEADLPQGRGFVVKAGRVELLQVGYLIEDGQPYETTLARWIHSHAGTERAQWIYGGSIKDLRMLLTLHRPQDGPDSSNEE